MTLRKLSGAAKRSVDNAAPRTDLGSKKAYMIAWLGELGGIQRIQITSDSPWTITRVSTWPVPVLVVEGEGKSYDAAAKRCMEYLRIYIPSWTSFIRGPVRAQNKGLLGHAAPPKDWSKKPSTSR